MENVLEGPIFSVDFVLFEKKFYAKEKLFSAFFASAEINCDFLQSLSLVLMRLNVTGPGRLVIGSR